MSFGTIIFRKNGSDTSINRNAIWIGNIAIYKESHDNSDK